MLSSRATKTLSIPFDPPHEVTIQKLSGRHLYKADTENDFAAQDYVREKDRAKAHGNVGGQALSDDDIPF